MRSESNKLKQHSDNQDLPEREMSRTTAAWSDITMGLQKNEGSIKEGPYYQCGRTSYGREGKKKTALQMYCSINS